MCLNEMQGQPGHGTHLLTKVLMDYTKQHAIPLHALLDWHTVSVTWQCAKYNAKVRLVK